VRSSLVVSVMVRVINLSRPGLNISPSDIAILVAEPQQMMIELGRLRTAVRVVLTVPDPFDLSEPLCCKECRYVLATVDRSETPWKSLPPDSKEIESKITELTAIGHKFLRIFDLLPKC
jgi:hypothetical protein